MRFFHPETPQERAARDLLLTRALRADGAPFPIVTEYPLVLSESGVKESFCLGEGETILAHANLWPRLLVDQNTGREIRLGLVGNVATDAAHRGKGLMRRLLEELKSRANETGLAALVLWSDLLEFYQKQGFTSYGRETRYVYRTKRLPSAKGWSESTPAEVDERTLATLLGQRFPISATLQRSPREFATLLTIPNANFQRRNDGYVVMGKGVDMLGVAHEWGGPDPVTVLAGVRAAAEARGYEECMLLAPEQISGAWHEHFGRYAERAESHPMALMWVPEGTDEATRTTLASSFIWGLDSI